MNRPNLGDKIRFVPDFAGMATHPEMRGFDIPREVTGRVVYINDRHRFYDVEYELHGCRLRESFKFAREGELCGQSQ